MTPRRPSSSQSGTRRVAGGARPRQVPAERTASAAGSGSGSAASRPRGLPTTATRAKAHAQAGADGASQGISQWLGNAEIPASLSVAAFDTVISKGWLSGSAAKAIAKALRRHQGRETTSVRSFVVTASKGPLATGQESDARSWGRELADSANTR